MILVVMLWITGCFVVILHCSWILRGTEYPDDKYMGRFIVLSGDGMSEGEMENGTKIRTLDELRENFSLTKVVEYFDNQKLFHWLEDRYPSSVG